jgi:hypothetical protein
MHIEYFKMPKIKLPNFSKYMGSGISYCEADNDCPDSFTCSEYSEKTGNRCNKECTSNIDCYPLNGIAHDTSIFKAAYYGYSCEDSMCKYNNIASENLDLYKTKIEKEIKDHEDAASTDNEISDEDAASTDNEISDEDIMLYGGIGLVVLMFMCACIVIMKKKSS